MEKSERICDDLKVAATSYRELRDKNIVWLHEVEDRLTREPENRVELEREIELHKNNIFKLECFALYYDNAYDDYLQNTSGEDRSA